MTAFVGRSEELSWLEDRLERALDGDGGVVFLSGDAGAGKSALAERFLLNVSLEHEDARVVGGVCSEQYGADEPYQPFVEAFRELVSGGAEGGGGKRSLREVAREVAPYWLSAIPVAGNLVAATMATAVELKETLDQGGVATKAPPNEEALFYQYTELLLAASEKQPVVLFLDDLHWADRASVSLLGHLGRKVADRSVLILGTYRPADVEVAEHPLKEAKLELERYGAAEELELRPLGRKPLAEFIEEELGSPAAPDLVDWLHDRAGSNPLFFGELLKWTVESGLAEERHGEWTLVRTPDEVEVPRSAESAIEKRLNRLDDDLYRVLEYGSVEGDEFNSLILSRLLDVDEIELEERIEPLEETHKLVESGELLEFPNGEFASLYRFTHSLVQDVLHTGLQGKRRILLHRKVAGLLEELYKGETEAVANRLAYHHDEGRQPGRALEFALVAAERASRVYAHRDAVELLERALENADSEERRVEVLGRLGEENRLAGRYGEALERLRKGIRAADELGDRRRTLVLKRQIARVDQDFGNRSPERRLEQLDELAEEARELDEKEELCRILWLVAHPVHGGVGAETEAGRAEAAAREALEIAEGTDDPELQAKARYELGTARMFGAEPQRAFSDLRRALEAYERLDATDRIGACHNSLAITHVLMGDYRSASEAFDAAADAFDEVGDPVSEASVRNNLGTLLTRLGEWEPAEENLREAIRLTRRMGADARLLHPLQNLAEHYQAKEDPERARETWEELVACARDTGYRHAEIIGHCGLGTVDLERGDLAAARERHETASELMKQDDAWSESREACQRFRARLLSAEGRTEEGVDVLETAEQALAARDRYLWATFRLTRAELLADVDEPAAAAAAKDAREVFDGLGAAPMRGRAERLLNQLRGAA